MGDLCYVSVLCLSDVSALNLLITVLTVKLTPKSPITSPAPPSVHHYELQSQYCIAKTVVQIPPHCQVESMKNDILENKTQCATAQHVTFGARMLTARPLLKQQMQ